MLKLKRPTKPRLAAPSTVRDIYDPPPAPVPWDPPKAERPPFRAGDVVCLVLLFVVLVAASMLA